MIVAKYIVAAGVTLTTDDTKSETVVAVVLAHSVLNLNFRKKVATFMLFVQRYVFGIDDATKDPQRCLKFVRQLEGSKVL